MFGLLVGVGSGLALALTQHAVAIQRLLLVVAALFVVLRGFANMFDGMIAVENHRSTKTGALFNEIPDRVSDAALFIGAGYAVGSHPTLGFSAACMALFIAFLRVVINNAGAPSDFGGIMAKQQRMFLVAAIAAWIGLTPASWQPSFGQEGMHGLMAIGLLVICLGGVQTSVVRIRRAARYLNATEAQANGHH